MYRAFALILIISSLAYADQRETLVIGVSVNTSNERGVGYAMYRGIQTAVNKINENNENGKEIQIILKNHKDNPDRARDHFKEFENIKNLVAIICGDSTPIIQYNLKTLKDINTLVVSPWAHIEDEGNSIINFSINLSERTKIILSNAKSQGYNNIALFTEYNLLGIKQNTEISTIIKENDLKKSFESWLHRGSNEFGLEEATKHPVDAILITNYSIPADRLILSLSKNIDLSKKPIYLLLETPLKQSTIIQTKNLDLREIGIKIKTQDSNNPLYEEAFQLAFDATFLIYKNHINQSNSNRKNIEHQGIVKYYPNFPEIGNSLISKEEYYLKEINNENQ